MNRKNIINKIGENYHTENIENGEFSYSKVLERPIRGNKFLDIRFMNKKLTILVETKLDKKTNLKFSEEDKYQLFSYIKLEKELTGNDIIGILHYMGSGKTFVYKNENLLTDENHINSFNYYENIFMNKKINNKEKIVSVTFKINDLLHAASIRESLRPQFLGTLLIALNHKLEYDPILTTKEIIERIKEIIEKKLSIEDGDENLKIKSTLLLKILDKQQIKTIDKKYLLNLLDKIRHDLIPFINNKTTEGEDLLNLCFTTFNKYVNKEDKNQAFTPTHITDFMADIINLDENSIVLDPTCGSGSFLVQAMSKMLKKCGNDEAKRKMIKESQLFGIEKDETPFGLATTNMMIHEDGKSNVILGNVFENKKWIKLKSINRILMNPPFNGQNMPKECPVDKKNTDKTNGFYFVNFVANCLESGILATILPLSCAIGNNEEIKNIKKEILEKNTLKAVFTLPEEIFYPGASVHTCIMLFEIGKKHDFSNPTFFGFYKNDGFEKKKNLGRIEKIPWNETKEKWLDSFKKLKEIPGFSVLKSVHWKDEWLSEAYMETDYSNLTDECFIQTLRDLLAYKIKNNKV